MRLSTKRMIILWATVLLVVVFLGLGTKIGYVRIFSSDARDISIAYIESPEETELKPVYRIESGTAITFYGKTLTILEHPRWNHPLSYGYDLLLRISCYPLMPIIKVKLYKYIAIVATLLVGLALLVTVRER